MPVDAAIAAVGSEVTDRLPLPLPLPRDASAANIAQFVALRAAACVGADYSNLALIDNDRQNLRLYHGPFLSSAVADRYTDVPVDAPFPIAAAVRTGKPVVLDGEREYLSRFPEIWPDTRAAGVEATVSIPLIRSDDSPIGAIGFAWAAAPRFDVRLDAALEAVANLVTEILERAQLYAAEHQMIADLHRRLLSVLPEVDGLTTAARYVPAGHSAEIGGDWFEGAVLDDDQYAVVVGDVTGHGLAAAADMALIRGIVTALLHDGAEVSEVFARTSRLLRRRPDTVLATAALAVIDRTRSSITYATAGHPSPLIVGPDGSVARLDDANAPILGIGSEVRRSATAPFPVGSALVMFTDGLVERRDRPFTVGIDLAVEILRAQVSSTSPEQRISSLIDGLISDGPGHDDVAVVVVANVG